MLRSVGSAADDEHNQLTFVAAVVIGGRRTSRHCDDVPLGEALRHCSRKLPTGGANRDEALTHFQRAGVPCTLKFMRAQPPRPVPHNRKRSDKRNNNGMCAGTTTFCLDRSGKKRGG